MLLDQLDLMDRKMREVADDIARHDSDKLLANGRFLAERFGVSSLQLDGAGDRVGGRRRRRPAEAPARRGGRGP